MPREVPDVAMLEGKPTIKTWVTNNMSNGVRLNSQKLKDFAEQIDNKLNDNKDSINQVTVNVNNRLSGVNTQFEDIKTQLGGVYSQLPVSTLPKMFGVDKLPYSCEQFVLIIRILGVTIH